jgi:hypothetical protein
MHHFHLGRELDETLVTCDFEAFFPPIQGTNRDLEPMCSVDAAIEAR